MIKNFIRASSKLNISFKQARSFSYLYNGTVYEQDFPDFTKQPAAEHSLDAIYSDIKDKKVKHLNDIALPYNFKGTKTFKPLKRAMDNIVLDDKKVNMTKVFAKLQNYSAKYIKALSSGDINELPPCESNFFVNVLRSFHLLRNAGFKLEIRQSPHELREKGLKENIEIFETMHILGLNLERGKNMPIEDYTLDRSVEGRGLLHYSLRERSQEELDSAQVKKLVAFHNQLSEEQKHPIMSGHLVNNPEFQLILRVYALYTTSFKLIPTQGGKEVLGLDDYTFRHVAIFENQLRKPPVGGLAYRSKEETIPHYRLQDWKLVDFDGVLQGNPLLVNRAEHSKQYYLQREN